MEKTTRRLPIVERDEWLLPAEQELNRRYERYTDKINAIEQAAGSIVDYANGYRYFGWQRGRAARRMVAARMAAGRARRLRLRGFQQLAAYRDTYAARRARRMERLLPGRRCTATGSAHGSLYKLHVHGDNGWKDRIPAYATRVVQDEATKNYTAQFWAPEPFDWQGDAFDASKNGSLHDLRGPCGHGAGEGGRGHLPRIHGKDTTCSTKGRLQRRAAHGHRRAPLLRVVRLPRVEFLRTRIALRHARGAEGAGAPRPRAGAGGHHGSGACPLRHATSTKASTSWTAPTTTTRCPARPVTSPTGTRSSSTTARTRYSHFLLSNVKYLARRVPFRRLPLRRRDVDDLPPPRLCRTSTDRERYFDEGVNRDALTYLTLANAPGARLPRRRP